MVCSFRGGIEALPVMQAAARHIAFRLSAGVFVVASWLAIGIGGGLALRTPGRTTVHDIVDLFGLLAWFVVPGALACLAGWRRDRVAALLICLSGIVGAAVVAWVAGVPEVELGADPAMRSGYQLMVVFIAAGLSALLGSVVVVIGYLLGRFVGRSRDLVSR